MAWGWALGQRVQFPERDRRSLFTQEAARRCEKSRSRPSRRYLSPGSAKGLLRASQRSYQLQTFICLRAACPPSGGVSCLHRPRGRPGLVVQVSPGCCCWRAPRAGPGGAGSPRLPPSQHGNNSGVRGRVVAAPTARHELPRWLLPPGKGARGRLVFHLAGLFGKASCAPGANKNISLGQARGENRGCPVGKQAAGLQHGCAVTFHTGISSPLSTGSCGVSWLC